MHGIVTEISRFEPAGFLKFFMASCGGTKNILAFDKGRIYIELACCTEKTQAFIIQ